MILGHLDAIRSLSGTRDRIGQSKHLNNICALTYSFILGVPETMNLVSPIFVQPKNFSSPISYKQIVSPRFLDILHYLQASQTTTITIKMFQSIYRTIWRTLAFGRSSDSDYELQTQVSQMRKTPAYAAGDIPPPTIVPIACHPKADEVCADLD
ncbi:MAG: hypothetical protein Q9218_008196, partial [Villophora microphyllina]